MLKPSLIVNAFIAALQSNQDFAAAMAGNIAAHNFVSGVALSVMEDIYQMRSPSCLVVWEGTLGGNFDGMTIWKHHVTVYIKAANQATTQNPLGYEDLVWQIVNGPVNGTALNIRQISLLPDLQIVDTPSITRLTDENRTDFFKVEFVAPEIGDN